MAAAVGGADEMVVALVVRRGGGGAAAGATNGVARETLTVEGIVQRRDALIGRIKKLEFWDQTAETVSMIAMLAAAVLGMLQLWPVILGLAIFAFLTGAVRVYLDGQKRQAHAELWQTARGALHKMDPNQPEHERLYQEFGTAIETYKKWQIRESIVAVVTQMLGTAMAIVGVTVGGLPALVLLVSGLAGMVVTMGIQCTKTQPAEEAAQAALENYKEAVRESINAAALARYRQAVALALGLQRHWRGVLVRRHVVPAARAAAATARAAAATARAAAATAREAAAVKLQRYWRDSLVRRRNAGVAVTTSASGT